MNNIKSYIIGDNGNDLFGTHNDAKLIYNLFYIFYLNKKNIWHTPELYLNNIFQKINKSNIILIYFSGHSDKNGNIIIKNTCYSVNYFLNLINLNKSDCHVIFIIDTCYGKEFIQNNKYKYKFIKKIQYFVSYSETNNSKEFLINFNEDDYKYTKINKYSKIVNGIFTYYFYKILKNKNYNINDFKKIKDSQIWTYVKNNFNQEIFYFSSLL
tara:strand:- start:1651 stop:2286 length:636 start_codon:yes stop_codon:yes gene_type:complete